MNNFYTNLKDEINSFLEKPVSKIDSVRITKPKPIIN